jgi:hypothetical protein
MPMPLRCLDATGQSIHSFDLSEDKWQALKLENRKTRHLRMPCCSSEVILRRSHLGTPYFAHKFRGSCRTSPETTEHLFLKSIVVAAARANGWTAQTEVTGTSSNGEQWRADILAETGAEKVAIEIQWSAQAEAEIVRRQQRYKASGIKGLWLLRQPHFPVTRELPAAQISGSFTEQFLAVVNEEQTIPIREFLDAAFTKRLRFGPVRHASISAKASSIFCWSCGARTHIITSIDVLYRGWKTSFDIEEFGDFPELLPVITSRLPAHLEIGEIKPRFSKTQDRRYLSNGCFHCDRLQGQFFKAAAKPNQEEVVRFLIELTGMWREVVDRREREYNLRGLDDLTSWWVVPRENVGP